MMKPLNNKTNNTNKLPAVVEATAVRKTDATKRNMDIAAKCRAKNRMHWRKNLRYKAMIEINSKFLFSFRRVCLCMV